MMKKFLNSLANFVINTLIILIIVLFISIVVICITSAINNESVEDSISYIKTQGSELVSSFTLTDKNSINLTLSDNSNNTNIATNNNKSKYKYYYDQLDDNGKIIYCSLENNIKNLKKDNYTIDFSTKFNSILNQAGGQGKLNKSFQSALDAFFYDYPELFYIDISKISLLMNYTTIGSKTTYKVSICPQDNKNYIQDFFDSKTDLNTAITKVENIRNNFINNIPANTSDYDKVLKAHDVLVNSLEYDTSSDSTNAHNLYGALVEKSVVCEGYAKSFKYILDSLGIECILVSGNATNSSGETESHMWNYVKLNGNWYGVDVTWDDPIIIGSQINKKKIRHDYFCKGSNVFNESHVIDRKISDEGMPFTIPKLSSTNYK